MLSNKYYVYKHTNKANGKVYIGITQQTPERRWQNGCGYSKTYFGNAIKKYGWDGFTHEVIYSGLTKEDACQKEKELICLYNSQESKYGYNICEGGQTGDNLLSIDNRGLKNNRAVSVVRINPTTGERIVFETIHQASVTMNINHRGISKACRGKCRTYKGFIWEYYNKDFQKEKHYPIGKYPHTAQMKKVKMIEKDGTVTFFNSIKEAGEKLGVRQFTVSRYISGLRKDPQQRGWFLCL